MFIVPWLSGIDMSVETKYSRELLSAAVEGVLSGQPKGMIETALIDIISPREMPEHVCRELRKDVMRRAFHNVKPMPQYFADWCSDMIMEGYDFEFGMDITAIDPWTIGLSMRA